MGAWRCVFVLLLLSLLNGQVASTAPEVCAWIVTPEAERKQGGVLEMRCLATNLESHYSVSWSDRPPDQGICDRHLPITSSDHFGRYQTYIDLDASTDTATIKTFIITELHPEEDTKDFFCCICDEESLLGQSRVTLSVLFFPSESPACSPSGPITVAPGEDLSLLCSSDSGNSAVTLEVTQTPIRCARYSWTSCNPNDTTTAATLTLTVGPPNHGTTFECTSSSVYFPEERRSCTIGPIRFPNATEAPTEYPTRLPEKTSSSVSQFLTEPSTPIVDHSKPEGDLDDEEDDTTGHEDRVDDGDKDNDEDDNGDDADGGRRKDDDDSSERHGPKKPRAKRSFPQWEVAFLVTLLFLVVSVVLNIILILHNLKLEHLNPFVARRRQPQFEPNIELQDIDAPRPKQPEENSFEESET